MYIYPLTGKKIIVITFLPCYRAQQLIEVKHFINECSPRIQGTLDKKIYFNLPFMTVIPPNPVQFTPISPSA